LGTGRFVLDGRPRFRDARAVPDWTSIASGIPVGARRGVFADPVDRPRTFVAHDYKYDLPVAAPGARGDVGYIGMLVVVPSGRRDPHVPTEDGVSDAQLKRVRVPIGLDLGARSAPEIALAIMAEIQAARRWWQRQPLSARPRKA